MPAGPKSQPRPTDGPLRALCFAICLIGLGLTDYPRCLWADGIHLITGAQPRPTYEGLAVRALGLAGIAGLLGATIETGLVALGVRLTSPPEQTADYDDPPPAP